MFLKQYKRITRFSIRRQAITWTNAGSNNYMECQMGKANP